MNALLRQTAAAAPVKELALGVGTAGAGTWASYYPSSPLEVATYIGAFLSTVLIVRNVVACVGEWRERRQRMKLRALEIIKLQNEDGMIRKD